MRYLPSNKIGSLASNTASKARILIFRLSEIRNTNLKIFWVIKFIILEKIRLTKGQSNSNPKYVKMGLDSFTLALCKDKKWPQLVLRLVINQPKYSSPGSQTIHLSSLEWVVANLL